MDFTDGLELIVYKLGMMRKLQAFLKDESGATAIEYGPVSYTHLDVYKRQS